MALIENLQREDLNPIDEAGGYETLIREHGLTQEEAAKRLGKSRVAIANTLRLLSLPSAAKSMVKNKTISAGHARALLSLKDEAVINRVLGEIVSKNLSVRETEALVKRLLRGVTPFRDPKSNEREITRSYLQELEKKASSRLGRSVSIKSSPQGNGSLQLLYKSSDDLEKLLISLCSEEIFLDSK
jgi:ParB family chromosome partitioning protein